MGYKTYLQVLISLEEGPLQKLCVGSPGAEYVVFILRAAEEIVLEC
jgi:hypothetical protein